MLPILGLYADVYNVALATRAPTGAARGAGRRSLLAGLGTGCQICIIIPTRASSRSW